MRATTMALALSLGAGTLAASGADDDLTVIKRAVQHPRDARPAPARGEARWFRVRVDKREGGKVRLNLPLPFVRALGREGDAESRPFGLRCGRAGRPCSFRLSEALRALDAGQEFVSIEDEDASVRIWID